MRCAHGSSLIESLTALAVFAIGSACHATWIGQSMARHAHASRLIAATTIALSLEARMRANREAAVAGHYESDSRGLSCAADCHRREVAAADLWLFRKAIDRHLGAGASSRVACVPANECTISIAWLGHTVLDWSFRP